MAVLRRRRLRSGVFRGRRRPGGLRVTAVALRGLRTLNRATGGDREKTPYQSFMCEACRIRTAFDRHHMVHQGIKKSQGCDCRVNLLWLCRYCHGLVHSPLGRVKFYTVLFLHLAERYLAALEHRDARNRGECPQCAPKWVQRRRTDT